MGGHMKKSILFLSLACTATPSLFLQGAAAAAVSIHNGRGIHHPDIEFQAKILKPLNLTYENLESAISYWIAVISPNTVNSKSERTNDAVGYVYFPRFTDAYKQYLTTYLQTIKNQSIMEKMKKDRRDQYVQAKKEIVANLKKISQLFEELKRKESILPVNAAGAEGEESFSSILTLCTKKLQSVYELLQLP
jgi:hypothetical protein